MIAALAMADAGAPPRVLILFSNDRLLPANQRYDEGLRRALEPQGNQAGVSFFGEFLDATRLGGEAREGALEDYLKRRYQEMPPQVLVALGPEALQFLIQRRAALFPNVPLVFGGTSAEEMEPVGSLSGIAGLPMEVNVVPVVEALLAMRPETREVVLVHGVAAADRMLRDIALRQLAPLAGRVKVTDFPELPIDGMKPRLAELSPEKAVLYLSCFQGPGGDVHIPARVAREVAASASVPVIGPYDTQIGTGVLGVCVSPFEEEGMALGKVIRRVLDGEKPETIGILPPNPPRLILDDRQVIRWGIRSVPEGAELRYHHPPLWENHRTAVMVTSGVVILQGLLISGLFIARARERRAVKELRLSEARFSGVFHGSPAAISIIRQADSRTVDVNPGWDASASFSPPANRCMITNNPTARPTAAPAS